MAASRAEVVGYDAYWCERRSRRSYSCTVEVELRPVDRPEPDDALKCTWSVRVSAARSGRLRASLSSKTLYCRWASQLYGFKGPACASRCG